MSNNRDELFSKLLPFILNQSEESNIVKISKIVSHAFELNYLETEIIFSFFSKFVTENTENMEQKALKQHTEKC